MFGNNFKSVRDISKLIFLPKSTIKKRRKSERRETADQNSHIKHRYI